MKLFVREPGFYRQLAAMAVPIALQNLIAFAVSMADTVMVGALGEVQLSAVSIANQLGFIHMLLCFGVGSGAGMMISQFWGKRDVVSIRKIITMMYRSLIGASLIFTVVAVFFPLQVVHIFITDEDVIIESVKFLRIVGLSYILSGIASCSVVMLRSVRSVKISLVVYIFSLSVNVFLNWVLIFGNLGAPALGVEGAAIATCTAKIAEAIIVLLYLRFFERNICYRFKMFFERNLDILKSFFENAVPVTLNELLWGTGIAVISVVIGRMGREFTAANAICSVLSQLVTIVLFGVANAAAVLVGNTVGQGHYRRAKEYANTLMTVSFLLGLVSCVVMLLVKKPMLTLYNVSDLAKTYADQIVTIYASLVVFVSLAATAIVGVLRGGGDTRFALVMDILFMWCFCIPLGFFTGLYLGWPVWAVYTVLKSDEIFKGVLSIIRIARGNWINDLTIRENKN